MGYIKNEIMRLHDIVHDGLYKQDIDVENIDAWMLDQIPSEEWDFYVANKSMIMDMIESE
jgi:hypothetical protein